jgi:hypothetical protein
MQRHRVAFVVGFALLSLVAAPAEAIRLRYRFRKGEVATYRTLAAAAAQSDTPLTAEPMRMQMRVDVISRQRVLSVSPTGTAQIESRNLSGTTRMTAMGKTQTTKADPEVTVYTLTDRGRVIRYREVPTRRAAGATPDTVIDPVLGAAPGSGEGAFGDSDPLKALYGLNFPDRDLKPGDVWTAQSPVEVASGRKVVIRISSRFVGMTRYRGRECARIVTSFEMPTEPAEAGGATDADGFSFSQEGRITGQITSYFDVAEGREVYTDGAVAMIMRMKMGAPSHESGAAETAEMNSVMKMNIRQVFLKATVPGERTAGGRAR